MKKSSLRLKADKLMREYLMSKYDRCQVPGCYQTEGLEWCHIDSRCNMRLRYSENNCLVMCHDHHMFFHKSDKKTNGRALLLRLVKDRFPDKYEGLLTDRQKASEIWRMSVNELFYLDIIKEIQKKLALNL